LDEQQDFLLDEYDIQASPATIHRVLEKHRWSRKIVAKHAAERSEPLRCMWRARQKQWDIEQLVCLDESACNERTGDRRRGWSPINTPCTARYSIKRSERWSILPALSVDGYIARRIYQGAITSELFEDFLQNDVLPKCTPYPGPRSIIIMDNASIHRTERVQQLCATAGVILEYLPPYSPDFNPIEQSFKVLKAWIKRHADEACIFEEFGYFLLFAIEESCMVECRGFFKRSGYLEWD
jgi:transposase